MTSNSSINTQCILNCAKLAVILFIVCCASSTKLCTDDSLWYDTDDGKCKPCTTCDVKTFELAPCSEYLDTMCVNFSLFKLSPSTEEKHHKWHEMEGYDDSQNQQQEDKKIRRQPTVSKAAYDDLENSGWNIVLLVMLGAALFAILGALTIMVIRNQCLLASWGKRKAAATRTRLFSRDRLNTTEYMNNLAIMDKRLAMDELLEKKRRAVFEPQRLNDNVYVDEVFVNLAGIPRYEDSPEDSPDYSRSLLRLQERQ